MNYVLYRLLALRCYKFYYLVPGTGLSNGDTKEINNNMLKALDNNTENAKYIVNHLFCF